MTYKRCTVLLREDVYRRLKNKGRFGESFSDVVKRVLDELENNAKDEVGQPASLAIGTSTSKEDVS